MAETPKTTEIESIDWYIKNNKPIPVATPGGNTVEIHPTEESATAALTTGALAIGPMWTHCMAEVNLIFPGSRVVGMRSLRK